MRREGICNSPCWLHYNWLVREKCTHGHMKEQEITKHCDPQTSVDSGHSSLTVLLKRWDWWWDRKYWEPWKWEQGAVSSCPVLTSLCQPRDAVPLWPWQETKPSCETAVLCSLTRELPVCLEVLERHYIDYCLVFAGLQNVQGDKGKFRDF